MPVGFTLGLFCGLGGRVVSRRLAGCVLAAALACSVASFTTMTWIIPAAGQAFRLSFGKQIGKQITLTKGPLELTLSELGRQIDSFAQSGRTREGRKFWLRENLPHGRARCQPSRVHGSRMSCLPLAPQRC